MSDNRDSYSNNAIFASIRQATESIEGNPKWTNPIAAFHSDFAQSRQIAKQFDNIFAALGIDQSAAQLNQIFGVDDGRFQRNAEVLKGIVAPTSMESAFQHLRLACSPVGEATSKLKLLSAITGTTASTLQENQAFLKGLLPEYKHLYVAAQRVFEMETLIHGIAASTLPRAMALSKSLQPLTASLSSLSSRAAVVWEECSTKRTAPQKLSERLEAAPLAQTHEAARNVIQIIAAEVETEVEIAAPMTSDADDRATLMERLETLGLEFVEPWIGAKAALVDKRPDYIRHASVSVRELIDSLLVHFAPTKLVKAYPESAELLKNQPRKARLIYLSREVPAYAEFVVSDMDCILQTFYTLNDGTHKLKRPFSDEVMETLIARIEGLIVSIINVAKR